MSSGLYAGLFVFMLFFIGIVGFIMITSPFEVATSNVINDPVNYSVNNVSFIDNSSAAAVGTMNTAFADNMDSIILIALLLFAILLCFLVWGMLVK